MNVVTIESDLGDGESRRQREEKIFELGLNDQEPDVQKDIAEKQFRKNRSSAKAWEDQVRSLMMLV